MRTLRRRRGNCKNASGHASGRNTPETFRVRAQQQIIRSIPKASEVCTTRIAVEFFVDALKITRRQKVPNKNSGIFEKK